VLALDALDGPFESGRSITLTVPIDEENAHLLRFLLRLLQREAARLLGFGEGLSPPFRFGPGRPLGRS
jgi:hypothetical protein